jgi:outer membrane receptor protein involved in Fe transport
MLVVNPEKANTDDYDYQGRKYIPIGDANYSGIELYTKLELPYGLVLNLNYSKSKNVWGTPFGEEGRNVLYQDSTDTGTKYETGFPQTILSGNLSYKWKDLTAVVSSRYYDDIYIMENNSEVSVDGHNDENGEWVSTEDSATLPSSFLTDLSIKYGVSKNLDVQLQVHNLLNTEYWSSASSWGFQTGIPRSSTFSLFYRF